MAAVTLPLVPEQASTKCSPPQVGDHPGLQAIADRAVVSRPLSGTSRGRRATASSAPPSASRSARLGDRGDHQLTGNCTRRRWSDLWIGCTTLIGALLALPLAQSSWHGSEVAAVLAVSATAMLAGQRWAISLIAFSALMLTPTLAVKAFSGGLALWPGRIIAVAALVATVPGLLQLRRAGADFVAMTGWPRTPQTYRHAYVGLVAIGMLAVVLPVL